MQFRQVHIMLPGWRVVIADGAERDCKHSGVGFFYFSLGAMLARVDHDLDIKTKKAQKYTFQEHTINYFCELVLSCISEIPSTWSLMSLPMVFVISNNPLEMISLVEMTKVVFFPLKLKRVTK